MKPAGKIGVTVDGKTYFGTVVKMTYNPRTYHVFVPELAGIVEACKYLTYGAACAAIGAEQVADERTKS